MDSLYRFGIIVGIIILTGLLYLWIPQLLIYLKYVKKLEQIEPQLNLFNLTFKQQEYYKAVESFQTIHKNLVKEFKIGENKAITVEGFIKTVLKERVHYEKRKTTTKYSSHKKKGFKKYH